MFTLILLINILHLFIRTFVFNNIYYGGQETQDPYQKLQHEFQEHVTKRINKIETNNKQLSTDFYKFLELYIEYSNLNDKQKNNYIEELKKS